MRRRTERQRQEAEWQRILAAHNYQCFYCGRDDVPMAREHMVPRSRGGGDELENIVPSCTTCNGQKLDRTPLEWILWKMGHWRQDLRQRTFKLVELKPGERWAWWPLFGMYVAVVREYENNRWYDYRVRLPWGLERDVSAAEIVLTPTERDRHA